MTGFIRGLFSKLKPDEAATPAPVERPKQEKVERPKTKKEQSAFFLESTEAQTFGNLEYMQTSKKTRRTFPKTLDNPNGNDYVQETSATGRVIPGKPQAATPKVESEPTQSAPTADTAAERRKAASDMDMFRKMAKDIRK